VNLELESLVRLLSSSDIVVHGEMVVYTSVQVSGREGRRLIA
jgi:hypothetical protein